MSVKPSEEEEKYFKAEDRRLVGEMRGEIEATEQVKAQWLEIARSVGSEDEAIGQRLQRLGFNAETARILFFVPLIEVAWADGKIGYEESYRVVDQVRHHGIRATSAAYDYLSQLTLNRPSAEYFDGCNAVIRQLLAGMPQERREQEINSLTDLVLQVARASRGFFGFGKEVSKEEKDAIDQIVSELGLENSERTRQLLKDL